MQGRAEAEPARRLPGWFWALYGNASHLDLEYQRQFLFNHNTDLGSAVRAEHCAAIILHSPLPPPSGLPQERRVGMGILTGLPVNLPVNSFSGKNLLYQSKYL